MKMSSFREIPDSPQELSGPLPRRIRLSGNLAYLLKVVTLGIGLLVALVLWMSIGAVHQMRQRSALRQGGVEAMGEITQLGRAGKGGYMAHYTFAANGRTFSGNAEVPDELMQSLGESNSLPVRYLPSDPGINHPAAWEWSLLSFCIGVAFPITFAAGGGIPLAKYYRRRRLVTVGAPVAGLVTQCVFKRLFFLYSYEFTTEKGETFSGSGRSAVNQEIGESIWILYLPQNPRQNLPYPDSEFIVVAGGAGL